jgi:FkbM family methyltransferase
MALLNTIEFILRHPLNRGRRGKSLLRFIRWQLGSRLVSGPVSVPFVDSTRLLISRGQAGATGNIYTGLHDLPEMAFVLHLLRPDDLFVDAGANVGAYTLLAAGACGAKVVAFEPAHAAFDSLRANVRLNSIEDLVDARQSAVGDEQGELLFTSDLDAMNHVAVDGEALAVSKASVTTLDHALGNLEPYCIKIDVEGFEAQVIAGAAATIAKRSLNAIIMETGAGARYSTSDGDLHDHLVAHGFSAFGYDAFTRVLRPLRTRNLFGNTIYIRDYTSAAERVKTARTFSLADGRTI